MKNSSQNLIIIEDYFDTDFIFDENNIFCTHEDNEKSIPEIVSRTVFKRFSPRLKIVNDALLLPGLVLKKEWSVDVVYDKELKPIIETRLTRHDFQIPNEFRPNPLLQDIAAVKENLEYIEGRSIYGGVLFDAFGHFITETLARLWALNNAEKISDDLTFIFYLTGAEAKDPQKTIELMKEKKYFEYFDMLGIHEKQIKVVESPLICKELVIPDPALYIHNRGSKQMANLWERIMVSVSSDETVDAHSFGFDKEKRGKKIFFSRSSVKNPFGGRRLLNEIELEQFLAKEGFEIIHPHDIDSEKEKIALLSNTDVLIGPTGGGLLNAAFMKSGSTVVQLINTKFSQGHLMQINLCLTKDIDLYSIVANYSDIDAEWEIDIDKVKEVLTKIGIIGKGAS